MELTFNNVPSQMSDAVDGVESKWQGNDTLGGVFEPLWDTMHKVDDMRRI